MNWISISQKLPEINQQVLAFGQDYGNESYMPDNDDPYIIKLCVYEQEEVIKSKIKEVSYHWRYNHHCCMESLTNVTYWMPLPTEPELNKREDVSNIPDTCPAANWGCRCWKRTDDMEDLI